MESGIFRMAFTGKLTKKLVENLGAGRHGDGGGLNLWSIRQPRGAGLCGWLSKARKQDGWTVADRLWFGRC